MLYFPAGNRFHLYDLEADPREEVDIFPERGDEVAVWQVDLRDLARAWSRDGSVDADAELRARLEALGY